MAQILYLEPDVVTAKSYAEALRTNGHQVLPVTSAQAAVNAADQQTPDLVIVELQLIEHSGIEFLYEFRSYPEWQSIPVIILTAVPPAELSSSQNLLGQELGVRGYYYKPATSLATLLTAVSDLIATPA